MRKTLLASAIVLFATIAMAQGRNDGRTPFVTSVEAPKLERILPPPPGITDSRFYDDWSQYQWGLSMRATERGLQARSDAFLNASYFMARFSPAMGHAVTQEANPQLFLLLQRAHATEMVSNAGVKAYYHRVRPYQQFKEASLVPEHESPTDYSSYPSGHTMVSWLVGMILTAIDPQHTESIMKVAYEMGQSRVIAGYHYQSDIEAGRYSASILFARLCAEPEFMTLLQQARQEYMGVQGSQPKIMKKRSRR